MKRAYWVIDCGSLHGKSHEPNWRDAFLSLVRSKSPRSLGTLARVRYICCSDRNHGSHFLVCYFDPVVHLKKAGLYGLREESK